jgi:hypothetical protein
MRSSYDREMNIRILSAIKVDIFELFNSFYTIKLCVVHYCSRRERIVILAMGHMSQTTNSLWTKFTETIHGKDEIKPYMSTETSSNKRASRDYHTGCTREQPHGDHTGRTRRGQ